MMEARRGSLGQYRKWAGVDPENDYSVTAMNGKSKRSDPSPQTSSSIEQMMNQQMRTVQAKEQNTYARQRVADQLIQGSSQFNIFGRGDADSPQKRGGFGSRREPSPRDILRNQIRNSINTNTAYNAHHNMGKTLSRSPIPPIISGDYYSNVESSSIRYESDVDLPEMLPNDGAKEEVINHEIPRIGPPARIKRDRKQKIGIIKETTTPTVAKHNPYIEELSALTVDIIKIIDSNVSTLGETNENRKAAEFEKSEELIGERRRQIRELLAYRYQEAILGLPMWKHKLRGNFNPPPETVLKAKGLFQVIVWSMIVMFIKPILAIRRRKIERRTREQTDFARTLMLYADATQSWISKGVRFPLATLEQDITLDFEPRQYQMEGQVSLFHFRMMQLKVRIKSIVRCVCALDVPPDNITNFFISLLEEGNYFPRDFLWKCETDSLEFNSLGAVMRTIIPVSDSEKSEEEYDSCTLTPRISITNSVRSFRSDSVDDTNCSLNDTSQVSIPPGNKNIISLPGQPEQLLDVGRARMLLQNFILIRILVGHVLLSPWGSSICRRPSKRKNRIIYNCRVTATVVYEIVMKIDALGTLPPVGREVRSPALDQGSRTVMGRLSMKRALSVVKLKQESKVGDFNSTVEAEPQSRMLLLFEKLFGLQSTQQELDDRKNSVERPRGVVEEQLLASRSNFEPLPILHSYLLKPATLIAAKPLIDEWLTLCSEELDEWISKVVLHVFTRRAQKKMERKTRSL